MGVRSGGRSGHPIKSRNPMIKRGQFARIKTRRENTKGLFVLKFINNNRNRGQIKDKKNYKRKLIFFVSNKQKFEKYYY